MVYYLSLGSNLGDRAGNLKQALQSLRSIGNMPAVSAVYETAPVGMAGAADFFNQVVCLETDLDPLELLGRLQAIEATLGRDRKESHMRPRTIDIDIILAGDLVMETPELTIPHPEAVRRAFVLVPLLEIAPRLIHPSWGKPFSSFLGEIGSGQRVRRIDPEKT